MTNAEYRAHPAISRSDLFKISKSPLHFRYEMDHPQEKTQALIFGSAFHKLVLEPDTFYDEFSVVPDVDRRTKAGREFWDDYMKSVPPWNDLIRVDDFALINDMAESIKSNKYARALLAGQHEQSFFWTDEMTGEECKCRTDILADIGGVHIIADLKTCTAADTKSFQRDMMKYGYDLQAYMYCEGVKQNTGIDHQFVFIAVEKTPPYAVNIMMAEQGVMESGLDKFREYIGIYHECKQTGEWWSYNGHFGTINSLDVPEYRKKEFE